MATSVIAGRCSTQNRDRLRALELTAPIATNPGRTSPAVIEELAETSGEAPAFLSDRERMTYRALAERSNQFARWALQQGLAKGDAVGLIMPNRPEYIGIWLGITRTGCTAALINTNCAFPCITDATVYGVSVPGVEGRAGMAALATLEELDLAAFRAHLFSFPPVCAHPLFPRIGRRIEATGTFKHTKTTLVRGGYDPDASSDTIYFSHPELDAFVRLNAGLYRRIQTGQVRL